MPEALIMAATPAAAKIFWVAVAAVVSVLVYRAAFPGGAAPEPQQPPPTGPIVDPRPRMRCPRCGEMVLLDARLCRFCGHRFDGGGGPPNAYPQ
jgi:hypothetical protein